MDSKILIFIYIVFAIFIVSRIFLFYALPLKLKDGQEVQFDTTLWADPQVKWNSQQMQVRMGDFWHSVPIKIKAPLRPEFSYGDMLFIAGKILDKHGLIMVSPHIEVKTNTTLSFFSAIRKHITAFCEKTLPQPYSSLVLGILLGMKKGLPYQLAVSLRVTGLSHLLVIDGMKVTLFTGYVITFLGTIFTRRVSLLLSILFIGIYMILSGLEISALRAGIMGIMAFGAQLWGRQYTGLHSLFLTSGFLLLLDPFLVENVGFQLSVSATAGIILLKPLIPLRGLFLDDISITLAAQIATLPVLLTAFGNYGLLSVPAHAFILWIIPPIMIISGTGVLMSFLSQQIGSLILQICLPLLWYFQTVALYFGRFNWNLQIPSFSLWLTEGYYMVLLSLMLVLKKQ